jgi:penicillin amidase
MKAVRAVLSLLLAAFVFWALDNRHGLFPPAGRLLNPFAGFCRNGAAGDSPPKSLRLPGLRAEVRVLWDDRFIPHIFASNDHDLYFAQGYVCAYLRLWQMDFQARYAAGRLAEVVGPSAVEFDRFQRRFGMAWSAERSLREFEKDPLVTDVLQAYSDGVNAYIDPLGAGALPVEYKILDYRPEKWSPLRSALLLKYMSYMLASYNRDAMMTRLRDALGERTVDALFPYSPPLTEPVIPPGTPLDFEPLTVPGAAGAGAVKRAGRPETSGAPDAPGISAALPSGGPDSHVRADGGRPLQPGPSPELGSNNWAVSGSRTKSGFPILANDMHLGLSLPAIWYAVQLTAPGVDVIGATFAGSPMVVAGLNRSAAWGFTNGGSDTLDWYAVKFRDEGRAEYFYEGVWKRTVVREEVIKVRGGPEVREKVVFTHHGPVVRLKGEPPFAVADVPEDAALRWTANEPSNEMRSLYLLNRVGGYEDYLRAVESWGCPGQNIVYADRKGDIAIWHAGLFPIRGRGHGTFILDGSSAADEWPGWVPRAHVPHVKNPERGFVSSANQPPVGEGYPYYLGRDYASFERAVRINELLGSMTGVTAEDMARMQLDVTDILARAALPRFLAALKAADLTEMEKKAVQELAGWDFEVRARAVAPTLFNELWREFNARVFDDEKRDGLERMPWPASEVVLDLMLRSPDSEFFDDRSTPAKETLDDIILASFRAAVGNLEKRLGPLGENWRWAKVKRTRIAHLARMPGLGLDYVETDGSGHVINAVSSAWAPSWRMVAELGPEVRARAVYPGGQSGNPGSRFYDNFIGDWAAGKTFELLFLRSPDDRSQSITAETVLGGVR